MLIEMTKDSLMNAVQHVIKAVAVNSPIPILQGINIQVDKDEVSFTASNTSMTIRSMISQNGGSVSVRRTGAIVIPPRPFYDVISKLDDEKVLLEIKEQLILTITSGNSQIRLCGMDSIEFPYIENREGFSHSKLRMNNAVFRSTIKQVALMASRSETRTILTGVSFECYNNSLILIATDGVLLASRTLYIEDKKDSFKAIIPAKNLYEVSKMISDPDETVEVEVSNNRVKFTTNGLKVESALIEGAYPSIKNIIPQFHLCELLIDRACLLKAVECVTVMASDNIIRLVATADTLKLKSRTAGIGNIENEVPLLEMSGEEFIISLNGKFFIDILRNSDCGSIRIRYSGKASPIVVLSDDSLMSALFLIPPVRTHN